MNLRKKLIIIFLIISAIPILLIGQMAFYKARNFLKNSTLKGLHAMAEFKEGEVFLYFEKLKARTEDFASDGFIRDSLEEINKSNLDKKNFFRDKLNQHLKNNKQPLDKDLLFIDVLDLKGKIVASSIPERVGIDKTRKQYFVVGKKRIYVTEAHKEDVEPFKNKVKEVEVSTPIWSREGGFKVIGVLVNHFDVSVLNQIFTGDLILSLGAKTQLRGLGATGETYLVDQRKLMITDSLFIEDAPFNQRVDTYPVRKCLKENQEVVGIWDDYRGVKVAGASMCIAIDGFNVVLLSEQDEVEALLPVYNLRALSIRFVGGMLICVIIVALFFSKLISDPIQHLTKMTEAVSRGNFEEKFTVTHRKDEIGILVKSFNRMRDVLKESRLNIERTNNELKKSLQKAEEAEEQFRKLLESTPDAVVAVNQKREIVLINYQTEQLFGYSREELIGQKVEMLMPECFGDKNAKHVTEYFTDSRSRSMGAGQVLYGMRKNGVEFAAEISLNPLVVNKEIVVLSAIRDITERKKTEEILKEKTERLQRFQNISVGRELEMIRLKKEINDLLVQSGQPKKYKSFELKSVKIMNK